MMIKQIKIFFAPLHIIKEFLLKRINEPGKKFLNEGILELNSYLFPEYNPKCMQSVFWQPVNSNITVMATNLIDGWHTLGWILNKKAKINMLELTFNDDYRLFNYNQDRIIRVMWDGHWDFFEQGTPFEFENIERYKKRLKTQRLTSEMIVSYTKEFGYDITDPSFYTTDMPAVYYSLISHT